ncbi:MAG: hypothetical protein P8P36_00170 [Akkermansiaceae bacterium]|nr:hypothetical protein [Akkermansiaceae bacterium]
MTTLQPESLSLTISADGRCLDANQLTPKILASDSLDILEIIIDAKQMHGGPSSSILGGNSSYLPSSVEFTLDHFEPLNDGTCLLRYKRLH